MTRKLGPDEAAKLEAIEALVMSLREEVGQAPEPLAARCAGKVARIVGSWKFLITQATILVSYIFLNDMLNGDAFDPYPFILLNLCLSFQAAFTAPVILMSQNRTDAKDRKHATRAYKAIGHIETLVQLLAEADEDEDEAQSASDENGSS